MIDYTIIQPLVQAGQSVLCMLRDTGLVEVDGIIRADLRIAARAIARIGDVPQDVGTVIEYADHLQNTLTEAATHCLREKAHPVHRILALLTVSIGQAEIKLAEQQSTRPAGQPALRLVELKS